VCEFFGKLWLKCNIVNGLYFSNITVCGVVVQVAMFIKAALSSFKMLFGDGEKSL
jgi:hypothetical protein